MLFFNWGKSKKDLKWNAKEKAKLLYERLNALQEQSEISRENIYANDALARMQARQIHWRQFEKLADLVELFETNWESLNHRLLWAETSESALVHCQQSLADSNFEQVLIGGGSELIELEFRQWIETQKMPFSFVQWEFQAADVLGELAHHPLYPLLHRTEESMLKNIREMADLKDAKNLNFIADCIDLHHRNLSEINQKKTIAFTTASHLIAENGALVFNDAEGQHAWMTQNVDTLVVFAGIDRIIEKSSDLQAISINKSSADSGLPPANQFFILPHTPQTEQKNGGAEIVLILLDNARSELLANHHWRSLLYDLDGIHWFNQYADSPYLSIENFHPCHFGPITSLLVPLFYSEEKEYERLVFKMALRPDLHPHPLNLNLEEMMIKMRHHLRKTHPKMDTEIDDNFDLLLEKHNDEANKSSFIPFKIESKKMANALPKNEEMLDWVKPSFMESWTAKK